ncbi:MAG: DUF4411 family protein [Gammaproteobacteria bacterium AqS3]|nr:DUF4411 family protein [Gammaproteobacteria bacterium AqS3]
MDRYCLDANTLTNPFYETYPRNLEIFQNMWDLLAANQKSLVLIKPIYDEVLQFCEREAKDSDSNSLVNWLEEHNFSYIPITSEDERLALNIRQEYKPGPKGISVTDSKLIAYVENQRPDLLDSFCLVTEESPQTDKSKLKKKNYKIPAVCEERGIRCINLIDLLRELSSGTE